MKPTTAHRVLIIGTGSIGERHLRCLLATGRVTASIVEVNPDLRWRRRASGFGCTGSRKLVY